MFSCVAFVVSMSTFERHDDHRDRCGRCCRAALPLEVVEKIVTPIRTGRSYLGPTPEAGRDRLTPLCSAFRKATHSIDSKAARSRYGGVAGVAH